MSPKRVPFSSLSLQFGREKLEGGKRGGKGRGKREKEYLTAMTRVDTRSATFSIISSMDG
jgi:hypothetical protein